MAKQKRRWEAAFLKALEQTGIVAEAARAAGVGRKTVYKYRDESPDFAARWEQALVDYAAVIEREAFRRAVEGVSEPIYGKDGEIVGQRLKYSDSLMALFLKATNREKFGTQPAAQPTPPGPQPYAPQPAPTQPSAPMPLMVTGPDGIDRPLGDYADA